MSNKKLRSFITLRVTKSAYKGRKGAVFNGVEICEETLNVISSNVHYIVRVDESDIEVLISGIKRGDILVVYVHARYEVKAEPFLTRYIITTKEIEYVRPQGKLIIELLSNNSKFKGIGPRYAKKLWERFGDDLISILDSSNTEKLQEVLSKTTAENAISEWNNYIYIKELEYCNAFLNLPISMSIRVSNYYQNKTLDKINEDPYRLMAFGLNFMACDRIAEKLRLPFDSPVRKKAIIEQALYDVLLQGSTVASNEELRIFMVELLKGCDSNMNKDLLIESCLELDHECENYKVLSNGFFQSNGAFYMEATVAQKIHKLVSSLPAIMFEEQDVLQMLTDYGARNKIPLTQLQKEAVLQSTKHNFFIINGGAGVGKTTVLDALYNVMADKGLYPIQLALSGKAAKRMSEATGKESYTIARFIRVFNFTQHDKRNLFIVIDESSMVDLPSMYRLLKYIPEGIKIIMVGDSGQLPPVDFGRVFHELLDIQTIPKITLTEVKRQSEESNIPVVANSIRNGLFPSKFHDDVQHVDMTSRFKIQNLAVEKYQAHPDETQIICATNRMADAINDKCKEQNLGQAIWVFADDLERYVETDFKVNDKVICCSNLYDQNIMNGSVGKIKKRYKPYREIEDSVNGKQAILKSFGTIIWDDGVERNITIEVIDALKLAYAITIHKSQGSQFEKVVVPIEPSSNLDRAMLYTAVTRAETQNIIIGSEATLKSAVLIDLSAQRKVHLKEKYLSTSSLE